MNNAKTLASFQAPLRRSYSLGTLGFPQSPVTTNQQTSRKIPGSEVLNIPFVMPRLCQAIILKSTLNIGNLDGLDWALADEIQ
jgi:hypothetical protein